MPAEVENDWGPKIKKDPKVVANGTGSFFGVDWTLASDAGKAGAWSLSFVDTNPSKLDFYADILVLLKGGNGYAAYLLDYPSVSVDILLAVETPALGPAFCFWRRQAEPGSM